MVIIGRMDRQNLINAWRKRKENKKDNIIGQPVLLYAVRGEKDDYAVYIIIWRIFMILFNFYTTTTAIISSFVIDYWRPFYIPYGTRTLVRLELKRR